jgi:hypothetical protein
VKVLGQGLLKEPPLGALAVPHVVTLLLPVVVPRVAELTALILRLERLGWVDRVEEGKVDRGRNS